MVVVEDAGLGGFWKSFWLRNPGKVSQSLVEKNPEVTLSDQVAQLCNENGRGRNDIMHCGRGHSAGY